jgi:hypothetical protein
MDGNAPWGGQGAPPPPSGPPVPMPPPNAGPPPQPQWSPQAAAKPQRRGLLVPIGVGVAVLLSAAALVISLVKGSGDTQSAPPSTETFKFEPTQVFVDDADRELCQAMGPLMNENIDANNVLQDTTQQNSPERKAAIPKFVKDTYDWADRAQDMLNKHSEPPRFLVRNYQRYIDDSLLFAEQLAPDRDASVYENQIYEEGLKDLAGLIGRCSEVDVKWWKVK